MGGWLAAIRAVWMFAGLNVDPERGVRDQPHVRPEHLGSWSGGGGSRQVDLSAGCCAIQVRGRCLTLGVAWRRVGEDRPITLGGETGGEGMGGGPGLPDGQRAWAFLPRRGLGWGWANGDLRMEVTRLRAGVGTGCQRPAGRSRLG